MAQQSTILFPRTPRAPRVPDLKAVQLVILLSVLPSSRESPRLHQTTHTIIVSLQESFQHARGFVQHLAALTRELELLRYFVSSRHDFKDVTHDERQLGIVLDTPKTG